jgi:hypothetical protein
MNQGIPLEQVRGIVFNSLVISNVLLTFVDRSFSQTLANVTKPKFIACRKARQHQQARRL